MKMGREGRTALFIKIVDIQWSTSIVEGRMFLLSLPVNPRTHRMKAGIIHAALVVLMTVALAGEARAQYDWDIGAHLGGANYLGEFGGKEKTRQDFILDMKLAQTRWAVGGFARRKLNRSFSVSAGLM